MRHLKLGPSGGKRKKPYYLNDMLQFVIPYLKPATADISGNIPSPPSRENQSTEIEDAEIGNDDTDVDIGDKSPPTQSVEQEPKRKMSVGSEGLSKKKSKKELSEVDKTFIEFCNRRSNKEKEDDPKKAFLISLLPDLRSMNDQEMRQFKRRVLALIDEIIDNRPASALSIQTASLSSHSFTPVPSPPDNHSMSSNPSGYTQLPNSSTSHSENQWWNIT